MNKDQWVKILKSMGMDHEAMMKWHVKFERHLPEAHTDFLESLGVNKDEIDNIIAVAQKGALYLTR